MLNIHHVPSPRELLDKVDRSGFSMADVCREAKVAQSTPSRWKGKGWEPKSRTIRKLDTALDALIERRDAAAPADA